MGCGGSTNNENEVKRRRGSFFAPKVRVHIGNAVSISERKPRLVLVFGGPGSKKGKLLQNLASCYDFELINMEGIVIDEISKKVETYEPGKLVRAVQNKLKSEQELLRLDAVLKMLTKKLESINQDKLCIIDLVPNLKWMLNNPMLIKDCTNELRYFEERFPVSFVLNFVISKETVLEKLENECAKPDKKDGSASSPSPGSPGQSDEADTGRTQKRVVLYNNSTKHFLEYFQKKDKIVTVDVSCGIPELVWGRVCEFFSDLNIKAQTTNETVIVYAFDSNDLAEINISQYSITVVPLKEIAIDPMGEAVQLIEQLCKFIDASGDNQNVFAVDCSGTSLSKSLQKKKIKKMIQFTDSGSECKLGKYCSVNLTDREDPADLRAVASIENEICLFVQDTPEELCKWVAQMMVDSRKKRAIS